MPRQARLDGPGLVHHVISRGIERRSIFLDAADYADFIDGIEHSLEKSPNQILAWALMPNHFHLLIRSGRGGVTAFMRRLLTGYATRFNRRHRRAGYLFQNRFKSIVCEEEVYLKELVRYIHLNPLRGGLVKDMRGLGRYPYTGHSALLGAKGRAWQEVDEVLSLFGEKTGPARRRYEEYVAEGKKAGRRPELVGGGLRNSHGGRWPERGTEKEAYHAQVLGSGEFVVSLLRDKEGEERVRGNEKALEVEEIAERIATEVGIKAEDLRKRGRWQPLSDAKAMLIYAGGLYAGKTNREMARITCMAEPSASAARRRGEKLFRDRGLGKLII